MKELGEFLIEANKNGYASGNMGVKNEDGSRTIVYPPKGDVDGWRFVDHFYGGEPYGGHEVVFKDGKPHWTAVYYGSVIPGEELTVVYPFLQKALIQDSDLPVRGPIEYSEENLIYLNAWSGDLNRFNGAERILKEGTEIYKAMYAGGLVDQIQE